MHFVVWNVILLYSSHRHVSATHVAVFRVVSARKHIFLECQYHSTVKIGIMTHNSFKHRCTFIKTLIIVYIKIRWLLHVSVYDHHSVRLLHN